jgi:hypothetical protein
MGPFVSQEVEQERASDPAFGDVAEKKESPRVKVRFA